jgi:ABC-type Fe3+-hydroxamate transport system substrate-binding protein
MNRILAWLLPILVIAAGCQQTEIVGGKPREKYYRSAISLSPNTTELLVSYFPGVRVQGRTASCDYPEQVKQFPVVANVKPDFEQIAKIRPDVVVYDASLYNANDIEKLKQLGIDLIEFDVSTVDEFCDRVVRLASQLAAETEISDYVDKIKSTREGNLAVGGPKRRVMIVLSGSTGEYMAAGLGTIQADFIRACGYEPIGPDSDKFETINIERIIQDSPEVIVVAGDPSRMIADPRLSALPAVQNKRVVGFSDQRMLLRAGTRVDTCISTLRPSIEGLFKGN